MKLHSSHFVCAFLCMASLSSFAQQKVDLAAALQEQQIEVVNRTLSVYKNQSGAVEMNAAQGDGLAILTEFEFEKGTIEVELKGENSPGRSFIGIAFNIEDGETFEAVYFRPFNFVADEQIRKDHMVQYICHPDYTWSKLREERTGEFENEISAPPNPNDWFNVIIEISDNEVSVLVDMIALPV
ncbi:MAG: hypothetical protein KAR16_14310, partial [Bacteroidales bacterium]|nr:hypothetical protein [Bacteroidales bacterium]